MNYLTKLALHQIPPISRRHPIPYKRTQRLIRRNPRLQPIDLLQQQIRQHTTEDDTAPVIQVRAVVLHQVVDLRRALPNGVDVIDAGLVQVEIRGVGGLGSRDGSEALVVQRVRDFVLGCE